MVATVAVGSNESTPRPRWALLAVPVLALSACAGDAGTTTTADPASACDFTGTTETPEVEAVGGPFQIAEVRHEIARPGCEERIVFTFESLPDGAELGYRVFYRDSPFVGPAGEIEVAGDALLEVVLFEASAGELEPQPESEAELVIDIVQPPEVPGGSLWLIGLEQQLPFAVAVDETPEPVLTVSIGAPDDS